MTNNSMKNYSIGLDIGTASVGWAVVDEQSKLLKKGNKPLWGYTLFETANPAANRRLARGARRRYRRRKQRIKLLQYLMQPVVKEVDCEFYNKLERSYQVKEDRNYNGNFVLFDDNFNDKEYYREYPTIYHLRHKLMTSTDKVDARLLYLALHHIVKYRGNFLYENKKFNINDVSVIKDNLNSIFNCEFTENSITLEDIVIGQYIKIIFDESMSKKSKQEKVKSQSKDKQVISVLDEITKAILGYKFNVNKLFNIESEYKSISFNDVDIEEKLDKLEEKLQEQITIIDDMKQLYDYGLLKDILANSKDMTISDSMINTYNKHRSDLSKLKKIISDKKVYDQIFKQDGLYDNYINHMKECSQEDFYKELTKILAGIEGANTIIQDIADLKFLPKINKSENGAIPYQLHLVEIEKIIDNQTLHYPYLKEIKDKITKLVTFRIPYYIGPLDENATNSWLVRKDDKTVIRPWNIEKVVDVEQTAAAFINRMRGNCTYLQEEYALPANSLLLARFNLYNEINKVRINNKLIPYALKEKIIDNLFLKKNEVTIAELSKWLIDNQEMRVPIDIKGTQKEDRFAASLKNEIIFREIFGELYQSKFSDIEKIIEYISVYNDEKLVIKTLKKEMPYLDEEQLQKISKLNYKGYGRLSAKFIDGIMSLPNSTCYGTIIEILDKTNFNMMQIINDSKFGFQEAINDHNSDYFTGDIYSQINELAGSPALKKGIWQSIKIVQDIVKYMKSEPQNIFIEFAREEGVKQRTNSRYYKLEKIYKSHFDKSEIYKQLNDNKTQLNSERLFLYFMQQGKCMYSGQSLDINLLQTYQVDHILPQSYVKDDSLENKALVLSKENQRKSDNLLLEDRIINKQYSFWKNLYDLNLIGRKKFTNLTKKDIDEKQQESFIARQLVETRQISLHVKNLLDQMYSNTKVNTVHAPLSSEVRRKFDLPKIRELNNCHHANDAYLACMVGQFINNKYPSFNIDNNIKFNYVKEEIANRLKDEKSGNQTIYSFIVNQMTNKCRSNLETGVIYWEGESQINYIKNIFDYKTYFMNYVGNYNDGELFNATLYSPKVLCDTSNKGMLIPIKNNRPVEKYGGHKSINKAAGMVIEFENKGKLVKKMVSKPIVGINNPDMLHDYIEQEIKTSNYKIIKEVKLGQMFEYNGTLYSMTTPEEWMILEPLYLSRESKHILAIANKNINKISSEQLEQVYLEIIDKVNSHIEPLKGKLDNSLEDFRSIEINEKVKVIKDILTSISSKVTKDIKIGTLNFSRFGRLSKKSVNIDKSYFVFSSPSGIFSTKYKL